MLHLGLLRITRGASVVTCYPLRVVLQTSLDGVAAYSKQETHHSVVFVKLPGASLTDN